MLICRVCKRTDEQVDFYDFQRTCVECMSANNKSKQLKEREWKKKSKYTTEGDCKKWNEKHPNKFEAMQKFKIEMEGI